MLDLFYGFILFFSDLRFILPLLLIGIFCINTDKFLHVIMLLMLSSILNCYLKSVWQIPLNPELLKQGWAYPSGHTTNNIVLWGSLYVLFRKKTILLIAMLFLPLEFLAMIRFRFHDPIDIWGGICLGMSVVLTFNIFYNRINNIKIFSILMYLLAAPLYILCLDIIIPDMIIWIYNVFGLLIATTIYINTKKPKIFLINVKYGILYVIISALFFQITSGIDYFITRSLFDSLLKGVLIGIAVFALSPFIVNLSIDKFIKKVKIR
jgi:membrane-associated phospholipid phosphatase